MADMALFDVVKVNIRTGRIEEILASGKRERDTDAIIQMAVLRQGVETSFFGAVSNESHKVGDEYDPEADRG